MLGANGENITIEADWKGNLLTNVFTVQAHTDKLAETFEIFSILPGDGPVKKGEKYQVYDKQMILEENGPGPTGKIQAKCNKIHSESITFEFGISETRNAVKFEDDRYNSISVGDIIIPDGLPKLALVKVNTPAIIRSKIFWIISVTFLLNSESILLNTLYIK